MKLLKDYKGMRLEKSDKHDGIYNLYTLSGIDFDSVLEILNNLPDDCKVITIFSEDRDLTNLVKYYGECLLDKLKDEMALSSIEVDGKTLFILERKQGGK